MKIPIYLKQIDMEIWKEEIDPFIPSRIFDVHTHIYNWSHTNKPYSEPNGWQELIGKKFPLSSLEILNVCDGVLMPNREVHRLSFPFPFLYCDFAKANHYVSSQIHKDPLSASLMLIHPDMTAEELDETIKKERFVGFKPYCSYSTIGNSIECRITDFLPEHQIAVANKYGLIIMLHLSKKAGISDKENLNDLERLTNLFPNVKWILAHCARSYYNIPLMKAKEILLRIPNSWYEISSVCDSETMNTLLSIVGPERVMYGSDDLPVGICRGKYITFGHAWAYLNEHNHNLDLSHCNSSMIFVRYEMLRTFCTAIYRQKYSKNDIENLFYGNADRLLSLVRMNLQ